MDITNNNAQQEDFSLLKAVNLIEKAFFNIMAVIAAFFLISLSVIVLLQIFSRLFLESSPVWTEELSRYLFIYTIASGVGLAFTRGELVSVGIIASKFSGVNKTIYKLFINTIVLGFCFALIPYSIDYMNIGKFQLSPTLFIPMSYIYASTLLIFINLAIFVSLDTLKLLLSSFSMEKS